MEIRPINTTDFEQWNILWQGYITFYDSVVSPEVTKTTWARFFDAYEPVRALVAEQEGQLVGLVHYLFHRNTWMIEPVCYLEDLFTAEDARGTGVGRALIEAVYDRAKDAGVSRVYWLTHQVNSNAMLLYDKVATNSGFVVYKKQL